MKLTVNDDHGHVPSLPTYGQYTTLPPIALMIDDDSEFLCMSLEKAFARWTGEVVVDVVLDDGGRRKGSCDRSFGSRFLSDCEHACIYKASKPSSSSGRARKQKLFLQVSFDFLVRQFLDFAAPTLADPQLDDAQTWFKRKSGCRHRERDRRPISVVEYVGHSHLAELFC